MDDKRMGTWVVLLLNFVIYFRSHEGLICVKGVKGMLGKRAFSPQKTPFTVAFRLVDFH
jgi:hypothetical protein